MLCRGEGAKRWVWRGVTGKRRGEEAASDGSGRVRNGEVGSRWEMAMPLLDIWLFKYYRYKFWKFKFSPYSKIKNYKCALKI